MGSIFNSLPGSTKNPFAGQTRVNPDSWHFNNQTGIAGRSRVYGPLKLCHFSLRGLQKVELPVVSIEYTYSMLSPGGPAVKWAREECWQASLGS